MKYFDIFTSYEDLISHWEGISNAPTDEQILFAIYTYEDYSGSAFCLFERNGKLFEVYDSHCSCMGLENWTPEETSWKALAAYDQSYPKEAKLTLQELIQSRLEKK